MARTKSVKEVIDKKKEEGKATAKKSPYKKKAAPKKKEEEDKVTIEATYKKFEKVFPGRPEIQTVTTGSLLLDDALHGGWPRGRIVEVYGSSGTGKTTILMTGCVSLCKVGKKVVYLDPEWAVNESLLDGTGAMEFYEKSFFLHKAQTFAQMDLLMMGYLEAKIPPDLIVIDSAKSMLPSKKAMGSVEGLDPGLQARLMNSFLMKYKGWLGEVNVPLVIINQTRNKFTATPTGWNVREESAACKALEFWSDLRLDIKVAKSLRTDNKDKETAFGNDVSIRAEKTKIGPVKRCIIPVIFGKGVDNTRSMVTYMTEVTDMAVKNHGWYVTNFGPFKEVKCQGRNAFSDWIRENFGAVVEELQARGVLT